MARSLEEILQQHIGAFVMQISAAQAKIEAQADELAKRPPATEPEQPS
jgi:hypothetical protein